MPWFDSRRRISARRDNAKEAPRMNVHKNARTTPHSRAFIAQRVQAGEPVAAVARAFSVCDRTVRNWVERAAAGTLEDGSCRPHHSPGALMPAVVVQIQPPPPPGRAAGPVRPIVAVGPAP